MKELLVAYDFSDHADAALAAARELADALDGRVHLVHVVPAQVEVLSPYDIHLPEAVAGELRERAAARLEPVLAPLRAAGRAGEVLVAEGDPATAIVAAARDAGADCIVMGRRGLTGLKHLLLGSVAERTQRLAPCPVLTVHAADASAPAD